MAEKGAQLRPFWSGTITFGLVSIPVALFPANRPRSYSLRMLAPDGTPLERRYFCSKEDKEIGWDEIVRGYEIEKNNFVVVTDEELEALEPRKSRDIDLRLFVDRESIDPKFFQRAYFLTPGGESTKAYRLLAQVMEKTGKAGIATFVMRAKEHVIAILADNGILRAETLHFADEIRSADDVGLSKPKKPSATVVRKIEKQIAKLTDDVDFGEFVDDYAQRLEALAESKRKKGEGVVKAAGAPAPEEDEGGEVIDLMAALNRSLGAAGLKGGKKKAARTARAGKTPLEKKSREELYEQAKKLDISGRSKMTKDELIEAIQESA